MRKFALLLFLICIHHISKAQSFSNVAGTVGLALGGNKDGGHTWGDFNNDGCLDVIVNTNNNTGRTRLYTSNCNSNPDLVSFTDITSTHAAGLLSNTLERSVVCADYNNDGYLDFARNTSGRIEIYLNKGPSASPAYSFGNASQAANYVITNAQLGGLNSEGMAWTDVNGDGWIDLVFDNHNNGTKVFRKDVGTDPCTSGFTLLGDAATGLITSTGDGDYLVAGDLNDDGWADLLVRKRDANEDLYINDGDGTYTLNTNFAEVADNGNKGGVAFCDFDNDGDLDIFWTDASRNVIYQNLGGNPLTFTIHTEGTGAGQTGINPTEEIDDCACGDVDLDGDVDVYLSSNGGAGYLYRNDLNNGNAFKFVQNNASINTGGANGESCSWVDYDRDGDLDLYVNHNGSNNQLWRNDLINTSGASSPLNFLKVKVLLQNPSTVNTIQLQRHAIGALVIVRRLPADGGAIVGMREVNGGRGHGSQDPNVLHFGLPDGPAITYEVTVKFPNINGQRVSVVSQVRPDALTAQTFIVARATDEYGFTACNNDITLPIRLLHFDAKMIENNVILEWKTASEINNSHFVIERSADGTNFDAIGQMDGLGNSNAIQQYRYLDSQPLSGISYYRLKQVDFDDNFSYSPLVAVQNTKKQTFVYPNPTKENLYIEIPSDEIASLQIQLFDMQGKLLPAPIWEVSEKDEIKLNLQLNAGFYILKITTAERSIKERIFITH
jgi:FG-GAP-like repeat/Secretion system C-terminal sorting domain/ASPIC and UnbV